MRDDNNTGVAMRMKSCLKATTKICSSTTGAVQSTTNAGPYQKGADLSFSISRKTTPTKGSHSLRHEVAEKNADQNFDTIRPFFVTLLVGAVSHLRAFFFLGFD